MRNGEISYWWQARGGFPPRRPSLPRPEEADVCIVGAGYTGLWTAYYLKGMRPDLRVVVLEAAFAGYGASGRNGGWVTSELPGSRARYARGPRGAEGVRALEAALRSTVDEVGRVCAAEAIAADFVKGGRLTVATSPAQLARLRAGLAHDREWGDGEDVVTFLTRQEMRERINVAGALAGVFAPDSARVQPAALAAGLAAAAERRGADIYEATPVTAILPAAGPGSGDAAVARTPFGDVRAKSVLRCTEGYTAALPGSRRALLPMNSSMVVTEPLPDSAWKEIGWGGFETLSDQARAYMYAQRTADGRIALGGRGVPYRFGSATDHFGETSPETAAALAQIVRRMFPAAESARIEHAWCGVLGVPRDWCATVTYDAAAGVGWAGGYTGVGVAASNLAGRTLADLVLGVSSDLTSLPWVGHRSRPWEPEPARWAGVHGLYAVYRLADRLEAPAAGGTMAGPARLALGEALGRAGDAISGIPH
ncbi:FAD-binding oxidoreductase [Trebonia sp.]|uniref:NAD(P)/FAD-dependent oxidoreductase n=1 Tax=Trebonia sp. TaxID=2767075 RepID=UPI00261434F8|nr:FAD-binding oxidoreductase [Trebonia sp.]